MQTQQINIRLDAQLKRRIEKVAADIGLGLNDVFRVMAKKFADTKGFPFYVVSYNPEYNDETKDALTDSANNKNLTRTSRKKLSAIWDAAA